MHTILTKTLFASLATASLIIVCYVFLDQPLAESTLTLKNTGWHSLAKLISSTANSIFVETLVALGFLFGGYDALKNGLTDRTKKTLYICVVVSAAMIMGDVLKEVCGRARPPLLFEKGIYGFFPLTSKYLYYSFPSGHSLRIFSAMTALGYALPRFRAPALLLALLVGVSRVLALKHYPSDVLFGAFIGITVAVVGWKVLYPYGERRQN